MFLMIAMRMFRLFTVVLYIFICILINTIADPIIKTYTEGERAQLTCSIEFNEIIDITLINYNNGTCTHSDTYGIGHLCNGKTECIFNVSNSNIGSSCGANGTAMFKVEYNCIRNGGWSDWNTSASCPVTCGGAFRNITRTCSNPYPNEEGSKCTGEASDQQKCNTNICIYQNFTCSGETANWNCPDGHINVIKAVWETSRTCGFGYTSFKSISVMRKIQYTCENKSDCIFVANDHTFSVSCATGSSRCTIFDYVYTCIKAIWDDWSSWSKCTQSCGNGIQTRQRQCLNQMNTTDGYISDCLGVGTGSRSCNSELCPYCNDNKFQYPLPQSRSELKDDTGQGSGVLLLNRIFTVNCCGRIKMWEFMPVKTGSLKFIILRKTDGHKFKFVGSNIIDISASDLYKTTQLNVPDAERITIINGDIVGWFGSGSNIGYYDCIQTKNECPLLLRLQDSVHEGDIIDIDTLSNLSNRMYALNYSTSKNRPITISISSEPVTIPDHLMMDSFVMTMPISDPDYGDFIQDFKLDYNNDYFYLDTKLRSVYVKKSLPHVKGLTNTTLNFTCSVQDSCFNLANTTVTIISYNAPPVVTELPDILRIDLQQIQDNSSFYIFHVEDPSSDNVACDLSEISLPTDELSLKMSGNDAYLFVSNHFKNNLTFEYELQIYCNDGTDDTILNLTVLFCTKINCQEITASSQSNKLQNILVYVSIAGMLVIIIISVFYLWKRQESLIVENGSHNSSRNSRYISTTQHVSTVHLYDDLEENGHQQLPTDNVKMSAQNTIIYENTNPFI